MLHFVEEDWVKQIDFTTLERVNTKFHADSLQRREGDLIFRVESFDGQPTYLYLLLEFQSKPDRWMAVRCMVYVGLLYQQLIKEKKITASQQLPPVFPLVLYNGDAKWQSPTDLKSLIDLPKSAKLWPYQPAVRYYLIDESRFPQGKPGSLSGVLFRLEQSQDAAQTLQTVDELIQWLEQPEYAGLGRDFMLWLQHVFEPAKQLSLPFNDFEAISEVRTMLRDRVAKWEEDLTQKALKKGMEQGLEQGMEQGIEQGRSLGESTLLARQLEKRFGPLSETVLNKLQSATTTELEHWGLQFLDASSIDEVFQD